MVYTSFKIQRTGLGQYPIHRRIPFPVRQQWWQISSFPPHRIMLCRRLRYSTSHSRTWQDAINCCRRKSVRNRISGWNASALCYFVHPSSGLQLDIPAGQRYTACCACCTWLPDTAECWCITVTRDFTRSFNHWARLEWNETKVTSSSKSATDVSGNGSGIDSCLEQYPTIIFSTLIRSMRSPLPSLHQCKWWTHAANFVHVQKPHVLFKTSTQWIQVTLNVILSLIDWWKIHYLTI